MADSTDILSRLAKNFVENDGGGAGRDAPDLASRDIGGQFRKNQPYISGYFQVLFKLPSGATHLFSADEGKTAATWLASTVEGFTPHTQTINKVDVMGQGQIGSSFPASVVTTREFTCTFREYQHMPILNIIRQWTAIFDPFTGVSPLNGEHFLPENYKGAACIIQTKPVKSKDEDLTKDDIEELYVYQGVFPTNIPVDTAAASDITGNDTVQLSATFSFDGSPMTSKEIKKEEVANWFKDVRAFKTYSKHLEAAEGKFK